MRGLIDTDESLIVGPALEPLDLEEVKKQRRFSPTTLDTLFDLWISAARQQFEEQTGRQCITAIWERWLSAFPSVSEIELPHPPLQNVVSVVYDDADGVETTLDASSYRVIAPAGPYGRRGRIALVTGASWPASSGLSASVRIQFSAGYGGAPGAVPELAKYALLMLVGHFHKYGEQVQEAKNNVLQELPLGAAQVIQAFKYSALPQLAPLRSSALTESTWLA